MGYPPLEELLPKAGLSIYKLVRLAADRAIELADGKPRLIDIPSAEKTSTVALEEIRAGRVVLKDVADQFKGAPLAEEKKTEEKVLVEEKI
jgi:DNA-directed RNA polymerase omega subunit